MSEPVTVRHTVVEDAACIARVRAESWLGAYRGIVPDKFLDGIDLGEWTERQRRNMVEQPDDLVTLVAETRGLVVGWAVGGPNRDAAFDYAGELYAIYLLPECQRRGIGRILTQEICRWLVAHQWDSMILWVLEQNRPARLFYEALGGLQCGERRTNIGGASLPEVAYGWPDLTVLVAESVPPGLPG